MVAKRSNKKRPVVAVAIAYNTAVQNLRARLARNSRQVRIEFLLTEIRKATNVIKILN